MTRRKRSPFPTRHDSAAQAEEREARITEMLERLKRRHDQAGAEPRRASQTAERTRLADAHSQFSLIP